MKNKLNGISKFLLLLALGFVLGLGVGCAASVSPVPGMSIGFDLAPDNLGTTLQINPLVTGCVVSKSISWNWAEKMFCVESFVDVDAEPTALLTIEEYYYYDGDENYVVPEPKPLTAEGFTFDQQRRVAQFTSNVEL